ncbi:hypothetical protein C1H46_045230 [Malus baccata]|uniref:Uncharacterized protein n=1 Tax=Malus baccata TaxID=106549 RepID=A0A540K4V9_MALBA|nr:hypothetical protein C1H46_045230 [Malus baccata]
MCQPSLIGAKYLSSGIKRIDTIRLRRAIEQGVVVTNANDAQIGSKLPETPALVDKETKAKHVISGRHGEISSSQANPSSLIEKTIKPSAQTCVNPKSMLSSMESMRNSRIITVEGSKLCPDKPAKKKTKLSTLNISKYGASVIIPMFQFFSVRKCFGCDFECFDVSKCRNIGGSKVSSNNASRKTCGNFKEPSEVCCFRTGSQPTL